MGGASFPSYRVLNIKAIGSQDGQSRPGVDHCGYDRATRSGAATDDGHGICQILNGAVDVIGDEEAAVGAENDGVVHAGGGGTTHPTAAGRPIAARGIICECPIDGLCLNARCPSQQEEKGRDNGTGANDSVAVIHWKQGLRFWSKMG